MKKYCACLSVALTALALMTPAALADTQTDMQQMLDYLNVQLEAMGSNLRVESIEWMTDPTSGEMGSIVFANNRGNKQLNSHWVPFDPRRTGTDDITYLVDQSAGNTNDGLTNAQTEAAIDRAMATWGGVSCSAGLDVVKVPDPGVDPSIVDGILGFGTFGNVFADITHAGWVPAGVFSNNTIGVTFTLNFVGGDSNGDGRRDTGIREIYYNDRFTWRIDGNVDVETVALHEAGHGFSQGHFGLIFGVLANGTIHFAPLAVMNAAYSGVQQELTGTDNAGHCSIWGSWPN